MKFKKALVFFMIVAMMLALTGCGQSDEQKATSSTDAEIAALANKADNAAEVAMLITKIPAVDEIETSDRLYIDAARTAYNALTEEERTGVDEALVQKLKDSEVALNDVTEKGWTTIVVGKILEVLFSLTALIRLPSYALAILLLTIILKVLLHPMIVKQQKSMKAMQTLQPKLQALQKKYKDNPQKLQEMQMKIYRQENVSPFSSCLPLVAQMPIILILFYGLRFFAPLQPEYYTFFWIPYLKLFVSATPYTWILPVLCCLVTLAQQYLGMMNTKDQTQRIMLIIFPLMFLFIARQFPSGLALYWVFYGLITMIQMTWINYRLKLGIFARIHNKRHPEEAAAAAAELEALTKEHKPHSKKQYKHGGATNDQVIEHTHNATTSHRKNSDERDKPWH